MAMATLPDLLEDELKDIYSAENQLVKALPKMAKAAQSEELAEAFRSHLAETEGHVERLKQVFGILGEKVASKQCKAMKGLVEEGHETIQEGKQKEAMAADLTNHSDAGRYVPVFLHIPSSSLTGLLEETLGLAVAGW